MVDKTNLILGRRAGTGMRIGEDIEVQVLSVGSGSTRLRITAPRTCEIRRIDTRQQIREADNEAASTTSKARSTDIPSG